MAGNSTAKSGGGIEFAARARSAIDATPQDFKRDFTIAELAPLVTPPSVKSAARRTALTASRPIQCAEPSSPMANPQPPARAVLPCPLRPYANEPVPAFTTTAGPVLTAASRAICISPTTSTGVGKISASERRTISASSGRAAPAPPTQVRDTSSGTMPAATHACRTHCCSDSRAFPSPTRTMLLGPAVAARVVAIHRPPRRWS